MYFLQIFIQYNRSGQHDDDKDEWLSEKENKRWARAASWKTPGKNNVIRHQQAMIYSIALLDQSDFESIGRKMPKGTGVDATVQDGTVVHKHKVKKHNVKVKDGDKENKKPRSQQQQAIASAIEVGSMRESKLAALRMFLEFGSATEKERAKQELHLIAYGAGQQQQPYPREEEKEEDLDEAEDESDNSSDSSTD